MAATSYEFAIQCPNESEAHAVISKLYDLGYEWRVSTIEDTHWDAYKGDTVYNINDNGDCCITYGDQSYAHTMLTAEEFLCGAEYNSDAGCDVDMSDMI